MSKKRGQKKDSKKTINHKIKNSNSSVGGSIIGGSVQINGGNFIGGNQFTEMHSIRNTYIQNSFISIYDLIAKRSNTSVVERQEIKSIAEDIETEAKKGERADIDFLTQRFQNLRKMAPDILEVIIATLVNPVAGLNMVMSKIEARIATETKNDNLYDHK